MTKRWDGYIVMSVAVGMTFACGAWMYKPGQRELSALLASAQSMRDELARGSKTFDALSGVRTDVRNTNALLSDYRTRITSTPDLGRFIEEVSAVASKLGLRNRTIVPRTPNTHGAIVVLPIEISFDSGFGESFEFLRTVERLPRAVQIEGFAIKRSEEDTDFDKGDGSSLRTELTVSIFYEAT